MPQIEKQKNTVVKRKKTGDVWDRVVPVSEGDTDGLHCSIYGRGKTGKTRLVASFPKPVLIIGAEKGTKSISKTEGVDFIRIKDSDEVGSLIEGAGSRGYKTVAIDTASRLADKILAEILGIDELPEQKSWGLASRDQYGQASLKLKTLLRLVLDLPQHVIIVAHERNFNEESTSDLLLPSIGSALSPSVAGWLNGAVDYICQTFIREETIANKIKVGTKVITKHTSTGKVQFCLRVGPDPIYTTGFRLPEGVELPDVIINPTFAKIEKLVKGL